MINSYVASWRWWKMGWYKSNQKRFLFIIHDRMVRWYRTLNPEGWFRGLRWQWEKVHDMTHPIEKTRAIPCILDTGLSSVCLSIFASAMEVKHCAFKLIVPAIQYGFWWYYNTALHWWVLRLCLIQNNQRTRRRVSSKGSVYSSIQNCTE